MKSHVIAFSEVGRVEFIEAELPPLKENQILVRTEASVVSPGTELRCLAGLQPDSVAFPFVPGYGSVGIIEDAHHDVSMALGMRVLVPGGHFDSIESQWGGHCSRTLTSVKGAFSIPTHCSPKRAAMAMLVAIALRGLNVARPRPLDKIAVIGLGPIGLLSARLFQGQGCTVLGMDREPARVRLAADGGLDACLVGKSIADTVRSRFGSGADIVVDATGSGPVLRGSMEAAKDLAWGDSDALGSKLVIQGSYSGDFNLPYHKAFRKELNIFIPRDVTPREISAAIGIIAENKCLVDDLITCCDDPKHSPRAYSLLQSDRSQMTAAFDWTSYGI